MEDIPLSHLSRPQLVNLLLRIVDLLSQPVQLAQHTQTCPPLEPYDASVDPWNAPDIAQPVNFTGQGGSGPMTTGNPVYPPGLLNPGASTCLPRWLNWPLLLAFLEPITHRGHFGVQMMGFLNGDRLDRRLVLCNAGFFIHVLFFASPSLWSELYQSALLLVDTLHTVDVHPGVERDRRSIVFIAGGYTLILSRRYETVDLHSRLELIGGIQRRFPDLATENIGLVEVHPSMQAMDPIANVERKRYVVVPVEEDYQVYIALELNLPPYHEIGAISVPPVLHKVRLISQTGISLVCGPTAKLCICYHNGWELHGAEETNVRDGDFIVCWLDKNSEESARTYVSHGLPPVAIGTEHFLPGGSGACSSVLLANPRQ